MDGLDVRIPRNISHFISEQRHAHFLECRHRDARNFLQVREKNFSILIQMEVDRDAMNINPFSYDMAYFTTFVNFWLE